MLVIPIFLVNYIIFTKGGDVLKQAFLKHRILLTGLIIVLIACVSLYFVLTAGDGEVSNKLSIAQAQQIVDDTFEGIAKSTAKGAEVIMDACTITVNEVQYGKQKDVILTCSYEALDVKGALMDKIDSIMLDAYSFYQRNEDAGKKTNATKVNLHVKNSMVEYLKNAASVQGTITLYIYETNDGMQLYLSDEAVDTVTGGLITVTNAIKNTTMVESAGRVVDISSSNTLRNGIVDCLALDYYSNAKPTTGIGSVANKISADEAQQIVTNTFDDLAKSTAKCAQMIMDMSTVSVTDVQYGEHKDIIITCSYTAPDVKGILHGKLNSIMQSAYSFYESNILSGKMNTSTKVSLHVTSTIMAYLKDAPTVQGSIILYIYETADGMQLYLSDEAVDTITGGLLTVTKAIRSTSTVEFDATMVDITNKNTLRTGITDCIALENYSSDKPVTGNWLQVSLEEFKSDFKLNFIEKNRWKYLTDGLITTLSITLLAALFGIALGFIVAVIRCTNQMTGKLKLIDSICRLYLTIFRGTPVMVQLLILYFVCLLPIGVEKFPAAVVCFGLNSGAYVAEIVRGGIMSVDKGQIEAGRSLGFNYVQTMVNFVVPQAFRAILPSLANEFITLLKESSVAFYIGVADLTQGGLRIRSVTYSNFMPLIAIAVIYLVLVLILTKLVGILERRLAKSER